ncbi:TonB-dependent receptor [Melittangium boletus]|uniref:TonB-dependent receptor n=1 Tax=Melittangium boletus TaxID=83453 RepID=UPI003DA21232
MAALVVSVGLGASSALAQQNTSVLTGTVVNAETKKPVPDVVVTATSPSVQGEQLSVTDASGLYRIPQLPPGTYTLRFESEGFKPFQRTDVALRLNRTIRLNAELLPEGFNEEIQVAGVPPSVDVGSTRTGVSVDKDLINRLATVRPGSKGSASRSFESLADFAPTATTDAYGVSLNGTTSPENGFQVDGLSTGNPALGTLGTPLSVEFIQEVNIITGGFLPEYGRSTGGVLTAVTKSGSNEFHGSVFGNLTPGAFEGTPTRVLSQGSVITTTQRLWNLGDFGGTLGGPLVKDKLWFFAGVAPSFTRRALDRNLNAFVLGEDGRPVKDANGFSQTESIDGTFRRYFADQRSLQYIGKLTWQVHPDHGLTLSVTGTPSASGGNGRFGYNLDSGLIETETLNGRYEALAHRYNQSARDIALKLSSSFLDKRVLLDVNAGWHHQTDDTLPVDGSALGSSAGLAGVAQFNMRRTGTAADPRYYSINDFEVLPDPSVCDPAGTRNAVRCPVASYLLGGPGFLLDRTVDRYQANVVGTYLLNALGHHVIKAGADVEIMTNVDARAYSGGVLYNEAVDGNSFVDFRSFGYLTGPDQAVYQPFVPTSTRANAVGAFLQDSWSILDRVTLNAGLRYDTQTVVGTGGNVAFELPNQISPRVGLVYDFTRTGRSKLFASYARYYQNSVLAMVNSQFSNITRLTATRSRAPINGGPGCDPLTQSAPYTECRDPANIPVPAGTSTGISRQYTQTFAINSPVDPSLRPQSSNETRPGRRVRGVPARDAGRQLHPAHDERRHRGHVHQRDDQLLHRQPGPGHRRGVPQGRAGLRRGGRLPEQGVRRPVARAGELHVLVPARQLLGPLPPGQQPARPQRHLRLRPHRDDGEQVRRAAPGPHPQHQGVRLARVRHQPQHQPGPGPVLPGQLRHAAQRDGLALHLRQRLHLHPAARQRRAAALGARRGRAPGRQPQAGPGPLGHRHPGRLQHVQLPGRHQPGPGLHAGQHRRARGRHARGPAGREEPRRPVARAQPQLPEALVLPAAAQHPHRRARLVLSRSRPHHEDPTNPHVDAPPGPGGPAGRLRRRAAASPVHRGPR